MNSYMQDVITKENDFNRNVQRKVRYDEPGGHHGIFQQNKPQQSSSMEVQITGCLWWTTVKGRMVPPNMWVVHTRRGYENPLHLGLGISFYYNRYTDTFLVAPSVLQTLLISARCICKERQGILISAYVQYAVEDFKTAYQKLDFSDLDDPMRIVNIQLREQCEASIKDKVATLNIDEVLSDKRPIVDELTSRLRSVSDGQGLKIIQVQIKEAVVSSANLWDTLQKPFREEQYRIARLCQLDAAKVVNKRELEDKSERDQDAEIKQMEANKLKQIYKVELAKATAELEDARVLAESAHIAAQQKLDQIRAQAKMETMKQELEFQKMEYLAEVEKRLAMLKIVEEEKRIANLVSEIRLREQLIQNLPELVAKMPKPEHSQYVQIGGGDLLPESLSTFSGLLKGVKSVMTSTTTEENKRKPANSDVVLIEKT